VGARRLGKPMQAWIYNSSLQHRDACKGHLVASSGYVGGVGMCYHERSNRQVPGRRCCGAHEGTR
jgi:hypothetical protein